jgi:hypothetical protein
VTSLGCGGLDLIILLDAEQIAKELKTDINWVSVFSLSNNVGKQLNEGQLRFLKAMIIEKGISDYSKKVQVDNRVNCDHVYRGHTIETKTGVGNICTKKGVRRPRAGKTRPIRLNNLYESRDTSVIEPFNFLLIVDVRCAAIVDFKDLELKNIKNGYTITTPLDKLHWIIEPGEIGIDKLKIVDYDLIKGLMTLMDDYIKMFK